MAPGRVESLVWREIRTSEGEKTGVPLDIVLTYHLSFINTEAPLPPQSPFCMKMSRAGVDFHHGTLIWVGSYARFMPQKPCWQSLLRSENWLRSLARMWVRRMCMQSVKTPFNSLHFCYDPGRQSTGCRYRQTQGTRPACLSPSSAVAGCLFQNTCPGLWTLVSR